MKYLLVCLCLLSFPAQVCGQAVVEEPTQKVKAQIEDIKWIAGHWQGSAMGGEFEETWNPPKGNSMVGMFKLLEGDKVNFYEILTIVEEAKSLKLRLKHFGPNLVGWEEKDKSVEFSLTELTPTLARFEGLVFRKVDADQMHIEVVVGTKNGKPNTVVFKCERAPPAKPHAIAIKNVLEIDEVLSKQRNELTRHASLSVAAKSYLQGTRSIDYTQCPDEFTTAFKKHLAAWETGLPLFEKHSDKRGEMHELFDQLKSSEGSAAEIQKVNKAIADTWTEVSKAAKKFGVR